MFDSIITFWRSVSVDSVVPHKNPSSITCLSYFQEIFLGLRFIYQKTRRRIQSIQAKTTMATINCHYLSVTCTSTPINQESNSVQSTTRPTKIILPDKKPQKWSTGVAPGDYGGPPTTTKLRKYWGGEKEDPITSDDLIWNRDFMPHMKRLIGDSDDSSSDPRLSTVKV